MNMNFTPNTVNESEVLTKYAKNLTDLAASGKLDPVIGRESEIRRIIRILSRRTKNNPVLIGEPGVGKTAIIEGLAFRIIKGDVPEVLKDKEIYELDMTALISGAKFQGEFEERLKTVLDKVRNSNGDIILFIDEVHVLVGTGRTQGAMDASNILKPSLARGEIRIIGATTLDEHRKYIEKDSALERRMQKIIVNEPTVDETISILRGLKDRYEAFHGVRIHDNAIIQAAHLSNRYITDRFLPDKAIDLIDEASATIKTEIESMPDELASKHKNLQQLKIEMTALKKERDIDSKIRLKKIESTINEIEPEIKLLISKWEFEKKIVNNLKIAIGKRDSLQIQLEKASRNGDFDKAGKIQYETLPQLERKIIKLTQDASKVKMIKEEVNQEIIAKIVSKWTGIPIQSLLKDEKDKLIKLEQNIKKTIKGQSEAVYEIANSIKRSRTQIANPKKPIGVFLFMGPTGVGKTELAKQLAKEMFNSEEQMIRIDMSEFREKHSVSKLIGSPPGYVGFENGGSLTEGVRRKPYSIILLDEIEKAHPDVNNVFLQVFDDGRITDGSGKIINFKNTIIIMTSNIGSEIKSNSKFKRTEMMEQLSEHFKNEFLNRIDEIILFNKLNPKLINEITKNKLDDFQDRLLVMGYNVAFSKLVVEKVASEGYDEKFGARPIERYITRNIETLIANLIIDEKILKKKRYQLNILNSNYVIKERRLN